MKKTTWQIDPAHTEVGFAVKHMMIATVKGRFADVSGTITLDDVDPAGSAVEVTIAAASVDTRQEQRDQHLRSADFFDVEKYPELTFRTTESRRTSERLYEVTGDLTMRGVTRRISVPVEWLGTAEGPAGRRCGFETVFTVNRHDFREELPERMRARFAELDTDGDGAIDADEFAAARPPGRRPQEGDPAHPDPRRALCRA